MKRVIIGIIALAIGLGIPAPAGADPPNDCADPNGACYEFDWAWPYYEAFARHGISYLADDQGIPLMNDVDLFCDGRETEASIRAEYSLTRTEANKVVEAAREVCPS